MSRRHFPNVSDQVTFPNDGNPRLYSMRFCPYAQRAHLVLTAKNIPFNVAYINPDDKPKWLAKVSPTLKVPVLEMPEENATIAESLVIADFIDEKYPQNPLHSKNPIQKARDRMLMERFNEFIKPFHRIVTMYKKDEAPAALDDIFKTLDIFEDELRTRNTMFFGGHNPGMLDYMIWPWIERTAMFKIMIGEKSELDKKRFSELLRWQDEMMKDKAVKDHYISAEDHHKFFMLKQANNPDYDFLN